MSYGRLSRAHEAWAARCDAARKGSNAVFVQPLSIGARDFGIHLDVSYFVTREPKGIKRFLSKTMTGSPQAFSTQIDMFSQQDLYACASIVKNYLKQMLEKLW
jgi:hypothetical protein